jgi:Putative DNA-binding domain
VPSLRELQLRFVAALFDDGVDCLHDVLCTDGGTAAQRMAIHRNNLRLGFRKALALEFPVIEKLVGAGFFTTLARDFQREHPSNSGDLQHIGAAFATWLAVRFAGERHAYLAQVAALEWALQELQLAPERPPLQTRELRGIDPVDYAGLRLQLRPCCALLTTHYPVFAIWNANQGTATADATIDLDAGGDLLLARRTAAGLVIEQLARGEHALLGALAGGLALGQALDAALEAEQDFDLAACLQRCVAREVFDALGAQAASDSGCGLPIA